MSEPIIDKSVLIKELEKEDLQTLSLAYVYAKNMKLYGENVTKAWLTAVEQSAALEKAYREGWHAAFSSINAVYGCTAQKETKNEI